MAIKRPLLKTMNRHKTMLIQALPVDAKCMSIGLLQRAKTSRHQMGCSESTETISWPGPLAEKLIRNLYTQNISNWFKINKKK